MAPGAWEIMKMRRERVLVCIITPPELKHSRWWCRAFRSLQLPPGSEFKYVEGFPYDAARNIGLKDMIDSQFGHILYWDSDTIPPADVVPRLIETGRDLIGAIYTRRGPPFDIVAGNATYDQTGKHIGFRMPPYERGQIVPVDVLGMGVTLISRRCVQAVMAKHPRPFAWGMDLESIREESGTLIPRTSEDFVYCLRAKECGFQSWAHTGLQAQHELLAVATPQGVSLP